MVISYGLTLVYELIIVYMGLGQYKWVNIGKCGLILVYMG